MDLQIIEQFVDKSIEGLIDPKFDIFYMDSSEIPSDMIDETKPIKEDEGEKELAWKAIRSTVTDLEIENIENKIGHKYPESYKHFLKYKHFIELVNLSSVWFFEHSSDKWKDELINRMFDGWPKEDILDRGLIPFADYEDWGLTCFNTNKRNSNGEYEICIWDHEQSDSEEYLANSFYDLIQDVLKKRN